MDRTELKQLTKDFLRTYGYISKQIDNNTIHFTRPTGIGVLDELLVYFHEKGEESEIDENLKTLDEKFPNIAKGDTTGRRFFLSNVPLGKIPTEIKSNGFKYQVPIQFFDREFSSTQNTPLKELESAAKIYENQRIPQPFSKSITVNESETQESDLLDELVLDITNSTSPRIRIIIAPAGYGKTVLISSLYTKLLEKYKTAKIAQGKGSRPLMMLPGHIKRAEDLNSLINNFINDEYDYGFVSDKTFKFWINKGFAVWLLDGLEELILKIPDPSEFIYQLLDDYIYDEKSNNPQIILTIRKPLLATMPELLEVINEYKQNDYGITTYELSEWKNEQITSYIEKNLKLPENTINSFVKEVKENAVLNELCNVPYYCSLITQLKYDNKLAVINDEVDLVDYSIRKICEREYGKGLNQDVFSIETQINFFSIIALEGYNNDEGVLTNDEFQLWSESVYPNHSEEIKEDQLSCLKRHSVLAPYGKFIGYTQDIIRDYFLATGLLEELKLDNLNSLDKGDLEYDSFVFKYLMKFQENLNWQNILQRLWELRSTPGENAYAFRNILKLYLSSNEIDKEQKVLNFLNNRNLTGIHFINLDLSEANFQNSILMSTNFESCNLSKANFDRCKFSDTLFDSKCDLKDASTRGVVLDSIKAENKILSEQKEIRKYFFDRTNVTVDDETQGPCRAALDFKKFIDKFTRKRKGHLIRTQFLVRSVKNGDKLLKSVLKKGYLIKSGENIKVRPNLYGELVNYAEKFVTNAAISAILDENCSDTKIGCKHINITFEQSIIEN